MGPESAQDIELSVENAGAEAGGTRGDAPERPGDVFFQGWEAKGSYVKPWDREEGIRR